MHRNHPHAIDATSSWSRPASPDSRPRREAELRYVPKLPWLRWSGFGKRAAAWSGRGWCEKKCKKRRSTTCANSGAMRTRIERVVVRKCEDLQIDEEELRDVRFVGDSLALSQLSRISNFKGLNPRRRCDHQQCNLGIPLFLAI